MFSIFRKKKPAEPFPFHLVGTDMHSHILAGIDDGSPDLDVSTTLVKGLIDLGYGKLTATPHVMEDLYRNTKRTIQEAHHNLQTRLSAEGIDVPIRFAAEYLLDGNVDTMLAKKVPLLTLKDNLVLVEISFVSPPLYLREVLFELQMKGYQPVFAHPERYFFYHTKPEDYSDIKDMGCLFQCNLLSFSGYYGPAVRQSADYLVEHDMVDFLGTDIHHEKHLQALRELTLTPSLARLIHEKGVMNTRL